ncbi:hypothetical protein KKI24_21370 [bacterium]|nr:hypothetical protein [bacterium]
MRIYHIILFVLVLITVGCSHKVVRVGDEFLGGMSEAEISKMEALEKEIVATSEEQQSIRNSLQMTYLEMQILNSEMEQLKRQESILTDKAALYTLKNDPTRLQEAQQALEIVKKGTTAKKLSFLVLQARLADEKAHLETKGAELWQKIALRELMRAQASRVQQDKIFGDDPEKKGEKIEVSLYEKQLQQKQVTLQEKEKLRLSTQNKFQEMQSDLYQKMLLATPSKMVEISPEPQAEITTKPASYEEIRLLIEITKQEQGILKKTGATQKSCSG